MVYLGILNSYESYFIKGLCIVSFNAFLIELILFVFKKS